MKIISILCLVSLPHLTHAFWPTFFYPDTQLIIKLDGFDKVGCLPGEVSLKPLVINISRYTCEEYCPAEWEWTARSDGRCHRLSEISFKEYRITHEPAGFDRVTAIYAAPLASEIFFEFEMKTMLGWFCTQFKNRMKYVVCANDTLRTSL